jgi:hypothetical protein
MRIVVTVMMVASAMRGRKRAFSLAEAATVWSPKSKGKKIERENFTYRASGLVRSGFAASVRNSLDDGMGWREFHELPLLKKDLA